MPTTSSESALLFRIRGVLLFFMAALIASGVTAFPLVWELGILVAWFGEGTWTGDRIPGLAHWLATVKEGLEHNAAHYPFIACGTDWLAFAHIMIAVAFLGPLRDPIRNIWVVHWGMLCCIGILPVSLIGGPLRGVPFGWQLIDCSFGVFGIIPLIFVCIWAKRLETLRDGRECLRTSETAKTQVPRSTISQSPEDFPST